MYENDTTDDALETSTTDPTDEKSAEDLGDAISMPTLQRGER